MILEGVFRVFQASFKKTFKLFQKRFMLHGTHRSFPSRKRACLLMTHRYDIWFFEIVAALAFLGEKSRGISPSRGIFKAFKSHESFSSSCGIYQELSKPHPLHEKLSPSRGIYRLKILIDIISTLYFEEINFLVGSRHFQIPREFLPISPHLVGFIKSCPDPTPSTRSSPHLVGFTD